MEGNVLIIAFIILAIVIIILAYMFRDPIGKFLGDAGSFEVDFLKGRLSIKRKKNILNILERSRNKEADPMNIFSENRNSSENIDSFFKVLKKLEAEKKIKFINRDGEEFIYLLPSVD